MAEPVAAPDDGLPALAGGTPAKTTPYGQEPRYGDPELQQLREALAQGTLFYAGGRKVRELEAAFADHCGAGHGVACSSGTAALHAALIAGGVSPGDEVITSPITDMGGLVPILYQGAVPVFADLEPHTYNLAPDAVEAALTPQTRAIVAVHLFGNACDLRALRTIAERHDLLLIEDCAQAHGCRYGGRAAGTWGHVGCYSFNEFKHISCGDGGIIITDDAAYARKLRLATDKGYNREPGAVSRQATFLANNYRMTELQGAVALAQLSRLSSIVERRRAWCGQLHTQLAALPGLSRPAITPECEPSWWFYALRVQPGVLGAGADDFAAALRAEGVPAGAHYIKQGVYEYPLFTGHGAFERGAHAYSRRRYGPGLCPTAEAILDTIVMLPVNEAYTPTDLKETVWAIQRVVAWLQGQGQSV